MMKQLIAMSQWKICTVLLVLLGGGLILFNPPAIAEAAGRSYYVNSIPDSGCRNEGPGTLEEPWCDFTPANSTSFGPGDELLLARGAEWNQELVMDSRGSADNWLRIGAYGEGDRPKIIGNGQYSDQGIRLVNPSYVMVEDVEIGHMGVGIYIYFSTLHHEGLHIRNVYVHDIYGIHQRERFLPPDDPKRLYAEAKKIWSSSGILMTGDLRFSREMTDYAIRDVRMEHIEGTGNQNSISFDWNNGKVPYDAEPPFYGENLVQNVVLSDLYLHDDNPPVTRGCDDGMRLINISNAVIKNAVLEQEASCHSDTGTAAVLIGRTTNIHLVNTIITDTLDTASPDMAAIDYEGFNKQVYVNNSYFARNAGGGLSVLGIHGSADMNADLISAGNVLLKNGTGGIRRAGKDIVPTGQISDNLFYEPVGLLYEDGADFQSFTIHNNTGVKEQSDLFYAAQDFRQGANAGVWSYQLRQNQSWVNLAYDELHEEWSLAGQSMSDTPSISAFDMRPGTETIARVWTAPRAGAVEIRGMALQELREQEQPAVADITKNGVSILAGAASQPLAAGITGTDTTIRRLLVEPGDQIRFVVAGASSGNRVSWSPAVAYTSVSTEWNFSAASNAASWTVEGAKAAQTQEGLRLSINGQESWVQSADQLNVPADDYKDIILTLSNQTALIKAKLYFTTSEDEAWSENKQLEFKLNPMSGMQEYYLHMSDAMGTRSDYAWSEQLKQIRIVFEQTSGSVDLRQIRIGNFGYGDSLRLVTDAEVQPYYAYQWEFERPNDLQGWLPGPETVTEASYGFLNITSAHDNPYILSPANLRMEADTSRYIEVATHNNGSASIGKLYYVTNLDPVWSNSKVISFPIPAGSSTYVADMKASRKWKGNITQLRFDPVDGPGDVQTDYIRITSTLPPNEEQPYTAEEWSFDADQDLEGWRINQHISGGVENGQLNILTTGNDPFIFINGLNIDAATSRYITIRMKSDVTDTGLIYFATTTDGAVNNSKRVKFQIYNSTGQYMDYIIDTKKNQLWSGTVNYLRIDTGMTVGANMAIDSIAISSSIYKDPEPYTESLWDFLNAGGFLGWTAEPDSQAVWGTEGISLLSGVSLLSPAGLEIDSTQSHYIRLTIANRGAPLEGALYYKTDLETEWSEARAVRFAINSGTHEYRLNMRQTGWKGNITALKFVPLGTGADLSLAAIQVSRKTPVIIRQPYVAREWAFQTDGSLEGWNLSSMLTGTVSNGILNLNSTGNDPYMVSPANLGVDTAKSVQIVIRLRSSKTSTASVFFITSTGPGGFTSGRRTDFQVEASGSFKDYVIDMSSNPYWNGTLNRLRFDPLTESGQFEVDFIKILTSAAPAQ